MNVRKTFLLPAVAVVLPLTCATFAHAADWYLGVSATMESFDADYDKTTANGPGSPRGDGSTFHSDDSSDETMHGLGVLVGYRMPFSESGAYLSAELDFAHHSGTVRGYLPEAGNAPGRNEWGESWDEDWSYEKERSYGLTLKLGMPAETWMGAGASIYLLSGVRRTETRVHLDYQGCLTEVPCDNANLTPGTFGRDATVTGWTAGAGLEKMLGEHAAFRTELRYTDYENNRWTSFPGRNRDILRVPASVDADELGLSLGLVRYF